MSTTTLSDRVPLTFGNALDHLKMGERVAREGWNGKGMWLMLVQPQQYAATMWTPGQLQLGKVFDRQDHSYNLLPWIGMKTADDKFVPWLASQTDILADDWTVVE